MAPEILRYEKYDAKADLWSVGAVLYEMSVGRPPFRAHNHIELLKRIEHAKNRVNFPDEDPAKAAQGHMPVPADIKKLIRMLLKRNPVERAGFDDFFRAEALNPVQVHSSEDDAATVSNESDAAPPSSVSSAPTRYASTSTARQGREHQRETSGLPPDAPIGPDGQPYDPKLYTVQSTFHFRVPKDKDRANVRDKTRSRDRDEGETDKGKGKETQNDTLGAEPGPSK